jgi:hypothetical protein
VDIKNNVWNLEPGCFMVCFYAVQCLTLDALFDGVVMLSEMMCDVNKHFLCVFSFCLLCSRKKAGNFKFMFTRLMGAVRMLPSVLYNFLYLQRNTRLKHMVNPF